MEDSVVLNGIRFEFRVSVFCSCDLGCVILWTPSRGGRGSTRSVASCGTSQTSRRQPSSDEFKERPEE